MIDLDSLDRVSSLICRINSRLSINHVVDLKNRTSASDRANVLDFAFVYNTAGMRDKWNGMNKAPIDRKGIKFTTNGHIVLDCKRIFMDGKNTATKMVRVKIEIIDTYPILTALEEVMSWFMANDGEVYLYNQFGQPNRIVDPMMRSTVPLKSDPAGITFKPSIIEDEVGQKYQAVSVWTKDNGEITNLTASEFVVFKNILTMTLNNLYIANLQLVSQTIQYCTYSNMVEMMKQRELRLNGTNQFESRR